MLFPHRPVGSGTLYSRGVTELHPHTTTTGSHLVPEAMTYQNNNRSSSQQQDPTPIVYIKATTIQNVPLDRTLVALCDSGSTTTMINTTSFPFGVVPRQGPQADVFTSEQCRYDIILGRTELRTMGINFNFINNTISWFEQTIPMKGTRSMLTMPEALLQDEYEDAELFTPNILDRKYQSVTPQEVVDTLTHLELSQRLKLKIIFEKYKDVFNGQLGCHPTAKIKIRLRPDAKPHWQRPYSVPFARQEAFRRELQSMIKDGVLVRVGPSEWGFPRNSSPKLTYQ